MFVCITFLIHLTQSHTELGTVLTACKPEWSFMTGHCWHSTVDTTLLTQHCWNNSALMGMSGHLPSFFFLSVCADVTRLRYSYLHGKSSSHSAISSSYSVPLFSFIIFRWTCLKCNRCLKNIGKWIIPDRIVNASPLGDKQRGRQKKSALRLLVIQMIAKQVHWE